MKIEVLINCKGPGYKFNKGDTPTVKKSIGEKLINSNYAKELKTTKNVEKSGE